MIQIESEPFIKHYKMRIEDNNTFNLVLIHNELTGEITMTSFGISVNDYNYYIDQVITKFKSQMGLNEDGKKENSNLAVLNFERFKLYKLEKLPADISINIEGEKWKDEKWGWRTIGKQTGCGPVSFVFDYTNFEHIKKALEVYGDYCR